MKATNSLDRSSRIRTAQAAHTPATGFALHPLRILRLLAALAVAGLVAGQSAHADTATTAWSGSTDTNWSTGTNWASGVPTTTTSALFDGTFSNQPTLTANATSQGIWLASGVGQDVTIDSATAQTLTITGNATLNSQANAGIYMNDSGNHNLTIGPSTSITLSNNTGFYNQQSAGTLTISGGLDLNGKTLTTGAGASSTGSVAISGNITSSSGGSLTINTAATVTLSGANTYSGGTSVQRGTIQVNTGGTLGATTGALTMGTGSAGTIGTVGSLSLSNNVTVGAMTVVQNTSTTTGADVALLSIASGKMLTASSLAVGVTSSASGATKTALGTGAANTGTFTVTGNVLVGGSGVDGTPSNWETTVVDLSGLNTFNAGSGSSNTFRVGYGGMNISTVTLASTANTINVGTLSVGETLSYPGNNSLRDNILNLGTGSNALYANNIQIGTMKASGVIQFASSSNGSVTIKGAGGTGTTNITIGNNSQFSYQPGSSGTKLSLAGHTANVSAGTVIVGEKTGGGGGLVTADVTFDTGTFTATSIQMALISNTAATNGVTSTFTVGGPSANSSATGNLTVTNNFILAGNTVTNATASTSTGSLIINGGTVNVNNAGSATGGIFDTTTSSNGTSSTTLTLAGGTLDLHGGVIGGTATGVGKKNIGTLNFRSGTLQNVKEINGGATGLNKTTDGTGSGGTLTLSGLNTYTGATTVTAGTLIISSTGNITSSASTVNGGTLTVNGLAGAVTVNSTGTLGGNGTVGALIVNAGGTLAPGNSPGVLSAASVSLNGTTTMELAGNGGVAGTDFDNVASTGAITYGGALNILSFDGYNIGQAASYSLFTFGSQSGDFASVTVGLTGLTLNTGVWTGTDISGNSYTFSQLDGTLIVVPEPATWALLAAGLVLAAAFRRRMRGQAS